MKTLLLSIIWNEEKLIKLFINYYRQVVNKFIFIDYGSTDRTFEIIRNSGIDFEFNTDKWGGEYDERLTTELKNTFWIKYRNDFDWILIVDIDEFLYYPKGLKELQSEMIEKYNIIRPQGVQMVGDSFPQSDILEIKTGVPDPFYSKCCMFRNWIEPNYNHGCHECNPVPTSDLKYFESPDLKLLHYKYIDIDYQIKRKTETEKRLSRVNKENGWGVQNWTADEVWREKFRELKEKSILII